MPKVTTELMQSLVGAGVFPPRHQQGCPKNYLRSMPLVLAAKGSTAEQIKEYIEKQQPNFPCTCKEEDVSREW